MKFFTDELLNQSIFEEHEGHEERWNEAVRNYRASLELLKGKVSKAVWEMAYNNALHDATFLGMTIEHGKLKSRPTTIEVTFERKKAFQIRYGKISQFKLTYNESVTGINHLGINDCIYSELLEVDEKLISHELIFASGAKFFIQFEKIIIKK
ncbi:hypothetical protein [Paenibacillus sp. MMS18-CY102]|uniref:hypothetical protein n=1 Tax=Paenibacillus sp. MMS18-CY102 TaxID=2682849 RepID=UPI001365E8F6|nr:hypothetical protein [Paenibacillus sp. MMS18-CY102]MWC29304.1 hypothetical protein [Paenibacillus sp. MMS18-CY102]